MLTCLQLNLYNDYCINKYKKCCEYCMLFLLKIVKQQANKAKILSSYIYAYLWSFKVIPMNLYYTCNIQ